jgi:hypothetical protein
MAEIRCMDPVRRSVNQVYPQPVDKFVDNHVNYLQNLVLLAQAVALR